MTAPTADQLAKERTVLWVASADAAIVALMAITALTTNSLSLASEAVRGGLMTLLEFYALLALCAVHRHRLRRYRFGIGKVEQIFQFAIGAALVVSAVLIAQRVVATVFGSGAAATPIELATAAVVNAINTLINALGWFAMVRATRADDSPIFRAQMRARMVKLLCSLVVQTTMTLAALARDPAIAAGLDALGAVLVVGILVSIGIGMVAQSLPHLLDHPVSDDLKLRINAALHAVEVAPENVMRMRTRRCGSVPQVELTLTPGSCATLGDLRRHLERVRETLRHHAPEVDLSLALDVGTPRRRPPGRAS